MSNKKEEQKSYIKFREIGGFVLDEKQNFYQANAWLKAVPCFSRLFDNYSGNQQGQSGQLLPAFMSYIWFMADRQSPLRMQVNLFRKKELAIGMCKGFNQIYKENILQDKNMNIVNDCISLYRSWQEVDNSLERELQIQYKIREHQINTLENLMIKYSSALNGSDSKLTDSIMEQIRVINDKDRPSTDKRIDELEGKYYHVIPLERKQKVDEKLLQKEIDAKVEKAQHGEQTTIPDFRKNWLEKNTNTL